MECYITWLLLSLFVSIVISLLLSLSLSSPPLPQHLLQMCTDQSDMAISTAAMNPILYISANILPSSSVTPDNCSDTIHEERVPGITYSVPGSNTYSANDPRHVVK